jgi:hypothetical protein
MANDKNKTGRTPHSDAPEGDRHSKSDPANEGSPKPATGSGSMKQKADGDSEGHLTNDSDKSTPRGSASRGGQFSSSDRNSERFDDDDDDMDLRPGRPMGAPRYR